MRPCGRRIVGPKPKPDRYYMPSYVGARGWVALRLDVGTVDWEEVRELVTDAYLLTAPKRLAALLTSR